MTNKDKLKNVEIETPMCTIFKYGQKSKEDEKGKKKI
jgi:hypothetical protein